MAELIRTDSEHKGFQELVKKLDQTLAILDGDEHAYYHQFNSIDSLKNVVLIQTEGESVACGAFKHHENSCIEIKRMFTSEIHRGKGMAGMVLKELESWASELGYEQCILETGNKQLAAIQLYKKNKYHIIENYGQYKGKVNSICFKKNLNKSE